MAETSETLEYRFQDKGLDELRRNVKRLAGDFEDVGDEAQETGGQIEAALEGAEKSVEDLDEQAVDLDVSAALTSLQRVSGALDDIQRKINRLDGRTIDVDSDVDRASTGGSSSVSGGGGRLVQSIGFARSQLMKLGLSSGGAIAALGTLTAGVLTAAGTVAGITAVAGGLSAAALALATKFRDAAGPKVTTALSELKRAARALGQDFVKQMRPVLTGQLIPFLKSLAAEIDKAIPALVRFAQKWLPSIISSLKGFVASIPGVLKGLSILGRILDVLWETLEGAVELVGVAFFGPMAALQVAIEKLVNAFLEAAEWASWIAGQDGLMKRIQQMQKSVASSDVSGTQTATSFFGKSALESGRSIENSVLGNFSKPNLSTKGFGQLISGTPSKKLTEVKRKLSSINKQVQRGTVKATDEWAKKISVVNKAMTKLEEKGKTNSKVYEKLAKKLSQLKVAAAAEKAKKRVGPKIQSSPKAAGPQAFDMGAQKLNDSLSMTEIRLKGIRRRLGQVDKQFRRGMRRIASSGLYGATRAIGDFITGLSQAESVGQALEQTMKRVLSSIIQKLIATAVKALVLKGIMAALNLASGGGASAVGSIVSPGISGSQILSGAADGAVVKGPTPLLTGEYAGASSNPEIISPESKMRDVFSSTLRSAGIGGNITIQIQGETRTEGRALKTTYDKETRVQRRKGHSTR